MYQLFQCLRVIRLLLDLRLVLRPPFSFSKVGVKPSLVFSLLFIELAIEFMEFSLEFMEFSLEFIEFIGLGLFIEFIGLGLFIEFSLEFSLEFTTVGRGMFTYSEAVISSGSVGAEFTKASRLFSS